MIRIHSDGCVFVYRMFLWLLRFAVRRAFDIFSASMSMCAITSLKVVLVTALRPCTSNFQLDLEPTTRIIRGA